MDKDIAVLIIHALIKQLGMHRAGSRHRERQTMKEVCSEEKKREEVRERQLKEKK